MPNKARSRIGLVVTLTLVSIYAVKLTGLALQTHRATIAAEGMQAEVVQLEQQVVALEQSAAEAGTDAYVERWARENRHMAREGDIVVVPVAAPVEPPPVTAAPDAPAESSPWQRFVDWVRGD